MASHAHSPYLDPVSVGLTVALFSFSVEVFFASGFTCSAFGGSGLTADTEGCETSLFSLVIDCSLAVDLLDCSAIGLSAGFSVLLASED